MSRKRRERVKERRKTCKRKKKKDYERREEVKIEGCVGSVGVRERDSRISHAVIAQREQQRKERGIKNEKLKDVC